MNKETLQTTLSKQCSQIIGRDGNLGPTTFNKIKKQITTIAAQQFGVDKVSVKKDTLQLDTNSNKVRATLNVPMTIEIDLTQWEETSEDAQ